MMFDDGGGTKWGLSVIWYLCIIGTSVANDVTRKTCR